MRGHQKSQELKKINMNNIIQVNLLDACIYYNDIKIERESSISDAYIIYTLVISIYIATSLAAFLQLTV